jgi:hypothetical protein
MSDPQTTAEARAKTVYEICAEMEADGRTFMGITRDRQGVIRGGFATAELMAVKREYGGLS